MKTLLTIGHNHFILPDSANVNVLLKALSSAKEVDDNWTGNTYQYVLTDKAPRIEVKMINEKHIIDPKKNRKAIPEKAGPDAHNTFGS